MVERNNIPGIYNWCDKWCERCPLTSKCLLFEREAGLTDEEKDISNKAFWNNLTAGFAETAALLQQNAEKFGIDLDAISGKEVQESIQEQHIKELILDAHPLSKLSEQYPFKVKTWLDTYTDHINADHLIRNVNIGLKTEEEAKKSVLSLKEGLEVIRWYQFMVYIKSKRAVRDSQMEDGMDDDLPEEEKSYNGTAKVASISIDRSIQSWALLLEFLPEQESSILDIMSLLQKIKRLLQDTFPHAEKFIRPGFDDKPI
jgi:hypothetical protein